MKKKVIIFVAGIIAGFLIFGAMYFNINPFATVRGPEEAYVYMANVNLNPEPVPSPVPSPQPEPTPAPTPEPTPTPTPAPWELFQPYSLPETCPSSFRGFEFATQIEGPLYPIFFGMPDEYTSLGITTFRGNNFRNLAAWGTAGIEEERLEIRYHFNVGQMSRIGVIDCAAAGCTEEDCTEVHQGVVRRWTGVGWSGQPAIVQWDIEVQRLMNIYPEKRERTDLIEVIYGALDGYIYFFDLKTGQPTRDRISVGNPVKGGVTVDPRGYPILYVGQGDLMVGSRFGYYIYSLLDGSEIFFIDGHDSFSRRRWGAFDGNPVFDSANDRMILPGENGVIYSIKLNTAFDRVAGTLSIDPVISRYRHTGSRVLGTENSPAAFSYFAFFSDNSGIIQCLDLRTLEPVWMFDAGDDTDASLVLEWEEENQMLAIYTGTQVDLQGHGGRAYIRKLNAANGSVLWEYSYPCLYNPNVNGGVMATPIVGKNDMSHLVVFWVAKVTGRGGGGVLVAFDKQSGEIVWENVMPHYGWSSPVAVYTQDGRGYIIVSDSIGETYLIRGTTGEILYSINLGSNVEASPAVFGNILVVGTRGQRIFGVEIF